MKIDFFFDTKSFEHSILITMTQFEILSFRDNLIMLKKNFEEHMVGHSIDGINTFLNEIEKRIKK